VSRNISLLVVNFAATELYEWIMNRVSSDHFHNLCIFFVKADTLLPLWVVVEHVSYLDSGSLLSSNRSRCLSVIIEHHSILEFGDISKFGAL
jgi:hypothetical protein